MPIETVPGTALTYYLIAFDERGAERRDDPAGLMSQLAIAALTNEPITDVFLFAHGWKGDVPAARDQYHRWTSAMAGRTADLARLRQARPTFRPLLIGLHWPSLPFGDEDLGGGAVSFGPSPTPAPPPSVAELVDQYAARLAETPAARAALTTIFEAALADPSPPTLPPAVRDAYAVLDHEAALGSGGVAAPPGADREPFDAERAYRLAEEESVSFGGFNLQSLLVPLQQLSFWKMKDRARQFGETGGFSLLRALQQAVGVGRDARFHLMGHSFGCIAVSATVAGPDGRGALPRPVHSLVLAQGAFSLWSYCADLPPRPGQRGYFRSIIADGRVAGPIVTTQSIFDTAVGRLYPLAAGVARQTSFAPGELPTYGAVGTFGLQGPGLSIVDQPMLPPDQPYAFAPGTIYNLEGTDFIREGGGVSGAHGDILGPAVTHAVWEAARPGNGG